jgi:hypothetical protein
MATATQALPGRGEKANASKPRPGTLTPKEGAAQVVECPCGCGADLGPMWEKLDAVHPDAVSALREMMLTYRVEGIVSRRWEARKAKDAHLSWMGIQNGYYNAADFSMHMPFGTSVGLGLGVEDAEDDYETPTYDYVTNFYQAYGLAFQALMTSKIPTPKFRPASAQNEMDITTAKAADDVRKLNERNNPPKKLLKRYSWLGWCEGKIGGYVRYVVDGQRFGFDSITDVETDMAKLSDDAYLCSNCGAENPPQMGSPAETGFCGECGAETGPDDFRMGQYAPVPKAGATRQVPRGQVCITMVPGLEFHTPPWACERHEFPYIQWNLEVHKAKLKAGYAHAASKITSGGPVLADDAQIRIWRLQVAQGFPVQMPGDALANLVTYSRTWLRPWAFWENDDKKVRELLLKLFPDGAFVAFAGEAYCEARPEKMDDHWRVSHLVEGDGQNRPGVGDSSLAVNKQINDLSNIEQESADYGLPITVFDSEVLNKDMVQDSIARPGDMIPAAKGSVRPGDTMASKFFQTEPAQIPQWAIQRRQELQGPTLQFLTGIQPAAFGGGDKTNETAEGRNVARETAMGRLGLFYREMEQFYDECHLLGVRCYAENATGDTELPTEEEGGGFESKYIRMADLQGNVELIEQADEGFPALPSEIRATIQQLVQDPVFADMLLKTPANIGTAKDFLGLQDFVAPGEDMETKTRRIIRELLKSAPIQPPPGMVQGPAGPLPMNQPPQATIQLDPELDDPTVAMAEVRRWYQSDAGQAAELENPAGVENVRAFFRGCQQLAAQQAQHAAAQKPPSASLNYKDLTPGGKVQLSAQQGIKENPAEIQAADQQDQIRQQQQHAAKIEAIRSRANAPAGAQSAGPPPG